MAELATAGSVVGLISLGIQCCQGLTSYYSAWKSYDEQISQTYRTLDELRITCENLERELRRIDQDQAPAVQQVARLIVSCQDGIDSLRYALQQCHSAQIPQNLAAKIHLYRPRALYPFKKQTLQSLKDTVHNMQGNLSTALQILQLHISTRHEQSLTSLARAVDHEANNSRQSTREFRETMLQELTKLANHVSTSSTSLETTISMTLDHHNARMNQMKHDLYFAHSQDSGEVVAKLEAIDQSIKALQIGIISKPSLMRSVCEENDRLETFSGPDNTRRDHQLVSRGGQTESLPKCSCRLKQNKAYTKSFFETPRFGQMSRPEWKSTVELESTSHHRTCPSFASSASTTMAKFRIKRSGAFLSGAIEASITIARGAGGMSISPVLRCAHIVPRESLLFELVSHPGVYSYRLPASAYGRSSTMNISDLESTLDTRVHGLARLFRDGKASPYDVDIEGNTLLHVASGLLSDLWLFEKAARGPCFETLVRFFKQLVELGVPLNWTNDHNLTFLNKFLLESPHSTNPRILVSSATRLLDTGAEFARFTIEKSLRSKPIPIWMTKYIGSADLADALEDSELTFAIWRQSEQELDKALLYSPELINQSNGLGNYPLHLAVGWPYGVRLLLQHGAYVDATDQNCHTPLYYAIYLGFSETVRLLMKADCNLQLVISRGWPSVLWDVSQDFKNDGFEVWGVSQETRLEVLDAVIVSLAERRRDLQGRLANLQQAAKINPGTFRDDRVLDEYAAYAESVEEDVLRWDEHIPLRASTLLVRCRTVYHIENLKLAIAERLWHHGFHDIDVHDEDGRTPLMLFRYGAGIDFVTEIELSTWLVQQGAKLHRPQHDLLNDGPNPTRALHYVAAHIGYRACYLASFRFDGHAKQPLKDQLGQLSTDARLLLAKIFSDASHDDCICACSSQGCLASTMMLKVFEEIGSDEDPRKWSTLATKYLTRFVRTPIYDLDWLVKEVIRYRTFRELELRHTCCRWEGITGIVKLEPEEWAEIREEDQEKIERLESLLSEFEGSMGSDDLMSFLGGYWARRMDLVTREKGVVDEVALRALGVVLHLDETGAGDDDDDD